MYRCDHDHVGPIAETTELGCSECGLLFCVAQIGGYAYLDPPEHCDSEATRIGIGLHCDEHARDLEDEPKPERSKAEQPEEAA